MRKVALLGVGLMGAPFARHLVEQGLEVSLYNRTRSKAEAIGGARVTDGVPGTRRKNGRLPGQAEHDRSLVHPSGHTWNSTRRPRR